MPSAVSPGALSPETLADAPQRIPKLVPRRQKATDEAASNPPPPTPALPKVPDLSTHQYARPTRRILSERDHQLFLASATHNLIVSFVFTLSDSIRDTTVSHIAQSPAAQDPAIVALLAVLDEAEQLLEQCPPLDTGSRFGNPAFRDYLAAVEAALPAWHTALGVSSPEAQSEVATYLLHAFGNATRIDYGSGHELNFVLWLLCLRQLSRFESDGDDDDDDDNNNNNTTKNDPDGARLFPALALLVFPRYLRLMRRIQSTYYLEPAGSHGVWGLDDYQFLPFLLGASQLAGHAHLRPRSIHSGATLEQCGADYLYLDQITWVNASKTVRGLRWHSPLLDDISAARSWAKVEAGMRRMFLAEVLGKLPVAQHFLFGSLLPAAPGMSGDAEARVGDGDVGEVELTVDGMMHRHSPNRWGDCCGIKVPSAVGARQEARKAGEGAELRRLPFD